MQWQMEVCLFYTHSCEQTFFILSHLLLFVHWAKFRIFENSI